MRRAASAVNKDAEGARLALAKGVAAAMQADVTRGVAVDAPYCSRADGSEVLLGRAEEKGEKEAWKKEMKTVAMRAAAGCRPVKK